jgi:magnesium-transporting ATPase (P-type)
MAYRRYRKKRSLAGSVLSDTSYVANRLSWRGCIIFGIFSFSFFYWLIPSWLNNQLNSLQGNPYKAIIEVIFAKRIHWVQWIGIALGLICTFFAIRNYYLSERLDWAGERNVSFFSRILAKLID